MRNYDRFLIRAKAIGIKSNFKIALTVSLFFFGMFGYYSYAFYIGSLLVTKHVINTNNDTAYSAGDIMSCFFGIVFGVISLGMATPNIKAVVEGRVAGKMAYDVIERKPKIHID